MLFGVNYIERKLPHHHHVTTMRNLTLLSFTFYVEHTDIKTGLYHTNSHTINGDLDKKYFNSIEQAWYRGTFVLFIEQ